MIAEFNKEGSGLAWSYLLQLIFPLFREPRLHLVRLYSIRRERGLEYSSSFRRGPMREPKSGPQ